MARSIGVAVLLVVLCAGAARAETEPGRKRRIPPQEYGRVVLASNATRAKMAPVAFDHWVHRARYTCRVCHVDIGFAMIAGATGIRAADNASGQYCGACHNDRTKSDGRIVFGSCKLTPEAVGPGCQRCHSVGTATRPERDFASFAQGLPRGRTGNGIDWEAAERAGLVKPSDFVEGISIRRTSMAAQKDFSLSAKLPGIPDIIFSHAKHTIWSGCEGCHPELFGLKRGSTRYTMADIFAGKYCGACHVTVAFPTNECQRCHSKPVQ